VEDRISDVKSVMFDLDGTLIDSVPVYYRLMESILDAVGLPPVPKPVVAEFMVRGRDALELMIPAEMADRKEELINRCIRVGRRMSWNMFRDEVQVIPGVRKLFSVIGRRSIPIGVVTSTERSNIDRKLTPLARNGIKGTLSAVVAIEDAPRRKPAPDPLIVCAEQLAVPPRDCLYVGDSHVDIRAGRAAGMLTVGVLTGLDDWETLAQESPTMILGSVADLIPFFS
jgi:beta-phosphoglucomutase-like phosphatase (HAD superfamily)